MSVAVGDMRAQRGRGAPCALAEQDSVETEQAARGELSMRMVSLGMACAFPKFTSALCAGARDCGSLKRSC